MYLLKAYDKNYIPIYKDRILEVRKTYSDGEYIDYFVVILNPAEYALAVLLLNPESPVAIITRGASRYIMERTKKCILCQSSGTVYNYYSDYQEIVKLVKHVYPDCI